MSSLLRYSNLLNLCTPSISYDRQVQAGCVAFDNQMVQIIDDTGQVIMIPSILDLQDETLVDILAWQFHVDFYDKTRDLEFRKRLVQMSIQWHRTKGTMALVQEVIDTYWPGAATLQEWFEYKNPFPPNYPNTGWHDRYRFRIILNEGVIPTPEEQQQVLDLIDRYKPISRWPEPVIHPQSSLMQAFVAGYAWIRFYMVSKAPPIRIIS
jgi:phage tail P2-like protein